MFFEGSEKKVEVVVTTKSSLRSYGKDYWSSVVRKCSAEIISVISNDHIDAYLLSESSLFVWDDRFVMITCGKTILYNSVEHFINDFGKDSIRSVIFQRKNEYNSRDQITCFKEDIRNLKQTLGGAAYRLGHLDGHHMHIFNMESDFTSQDDDKTTEILMYHIGKSSGRVLRSEKQTIENIRTLLDFKTYFPEFEIDDYLFSPFGYSLNGLYKNRYITVHITPQEDSSYVSFETNLDLEDTHKKLIPHLLKVFAPGSYDLINFNTNFGEQSNTKYNCASSFITELSSGYNLSFNQYIKDDKNKIKATQLDIG